MLSVRPANGAIGVSQTAVVTVVFSEAVDAASVTSTTFSVGTLSGSIAITGDSATFTPNALLASDSLYTVSVGGIRDVVGNTMSNPFASSFRIELLVPGIANAGPDQDASFGETVTLDASASTGSALTFAWKQIAGPTAGALTPTGSQVAFTAPAAVGALAFQVTVTDGPQTGRDTVVVSVWEDRTHRLFVAPSGNDANTGTRESPFATIQAAIAAADAAANGSDVYVAAGDYSGSLTLRPRVSVYAGFEPGTWRRNLATQHTTILGGPIGVTGTGADSLTLEGLTIRATDATGPGSSSIALVLSNSIGVLLRHNVFLAANGSGGMGGSTPGANGAPGGHGSNGDDASTVCNSPNGGDGAPVAVPGGRGGDGTLTNGGTGRRGFGGGGGEPGGGGSTFNDGSVGGNAVPGGGLSGFPGTDGAGGAAFGTLTASGYVAAGGSDGINNAGPGSGGGGGGAGGGTGGTVCGPGGGGGGGGGRVGTPGTAGTGGGASIGVLLLGTTSADISDNHILTGAGGSGGIGRRGGSGGVGGSGGNGGARACEPPANTPCIGVGGAGGNGAPGGRGGHGGGGGGGPSIGIVEGATASSTRASNVFNIGAGGSGGTSLGNPGSTGESSDYKKAA